MVNIFSFYLILSEVLEAFLSCLAIQAFKKLR